MHLENCDNHTIFLVIIYVAIFGIPSLQAVSLSFGCNAAWGEIN